MGRTIRSFSLAILCLAATVTASPTLADGSSRPYGGGGRINAGAIIAQYNKSGERFRIEGSCQSSCTIWRSKMFASIRPRHCGFTPRCFLTR